MGQTSAPEVSPERIYFEAVRAAGTADDVSAWRSKVDLIAAEISSGLKAFVRKATAVATSITLTGVVVEAIENPVSEQNRALDLYKVVFRADAGTRPDQMWVDKRDPAGAALFATAAALVGKRATIVKEQRVQFLGDEPKLDQNNKPVTSPYLASILPAEAEAAVPAAATTKAAPTASHKAPVDATTEASPAGSSAPDVQALINLKPETPTQVVNLASEHFGMTPTEVKAAVEGILGPKGPNKPRTKAEILKAWTAICYARTSTATAA